MVGKAGLMPSKEDGSCIYLGEDNLCTVYDERPDICNVDIMYDKLLKNGGDVMNITKIDYFKTQNKACNILQREYGIDKKYRIDLEIYNKGND